MHLAKGSVTFEELVMRALKPSLLTTAFHGTIFDAATTAVKESQDELAYLSLTSKPEEALRNSMAWAIARSNENLVVAREWSPGQSLGHFSSPRFDLAALERRFVNESSTLNPSFAAEFKVYGFLQQTEEIPGHHREAMARDILKLLELNATQRSAGNQQFVSYFVVVHQTLRNPIPEVLNRVVKYSSLINAKMSSYSEGLEAARDTANQRVSEWLAKDLGLQVPGQGWLRLDAGQYLGIGVNLDFLICQVP